MTYDPNAGWQPQQPPYPQQPQPQYPPQPQPSYPQPQYPAPGPGGPTFPGGPQQPGGPPGAPPGYPPGPGGYGGPPKKGRGGLITFVITAVVALVVIAVITTFLIVRSQTAADATEVFLEEAAQPAADPFTTSIPNQVLPPAPSTSASTAPPPADPGSATVRTTSGGTPGLYGGTNNLQTCDPEQVIVFLEQNPAKARAWVDALNTDPRLRWSGGTSLQTTDIRTYIGELTSVSLATDTRVTNHGFVNGRPTARQAVLQAGTAVLVDKYGVPRVKCACGNPLIPPAAQGKVRYAGTRWTTFSVTNIVVVQQTTVVINNFVLVNPANGEQFSRPVGTSGSRDGPVETTTTSSATSEPPSSSASSSTRPSSTTTTARASSTTTTRPSSTTTAAPGASLPADFCAAWKQYVAEGSAGGLNNVQELIVALEKLRDASPPDLRADMVLVVDFYVSALRSGGQFPSDVPADVQAADQRLEAAITSRCG